MWVPGSLFMSYHNDTAVVRERLTPGTVWRIAGYARAQLRELIFFTGLNTADAVVAVASPLLLRAIIDDGIVPRKTTVITWLAIMVAGFALLDMALSLTQRWYSARIGEGLIYDLRTQVFDHVQRLPVAFFLRIRTGDLISRLNSDIISAQRGLSNTLSSVVSSALTLIVVMVTMFVLSWQVALIALGLLPVFIVPAKWVGRKMQRASREGMQHNAEMSAVMTERFNVAGATIAKLYGRPAAESRLFASRARRVYDIGISLAMYQQVFFGALILLSALATAMVYGIGGVLSVRGAIPLGTIVALATLLARLYAPLTTLSNVQVDVMTALVSFDRLFEVFDLKPMIDDQPGSVPLPRTGSPAIDFDDVTFRYPRADEVMLASLAPIARTDSMPEREVLHGVSFHAAPGTLTALVGPSGAGKTTITQLISRLYDVSAGVVRIDGHDVREVTQASLRTAVGVVPQDPHVFHDSIRANLGYARPDASEQDMIKALRSAQIWDQLVSTLPEGLDTIVGDRGYRLSGGEKQRLAIARLLLKEPAIVILDEATAHLDSESEAAVQRAMKTALSGRTSIVIAHRLSTIQEADQILVIDDGRVVQRGGHANLLAAGGLYGELYHTQYTRHEYTPR